MERIATPEAADEETPHAEAHVAEVGEALTVEPARVADPVLYELVWRARRLAVDIDAEVEGAAVPAVAEPLAREAAPRRAAVLITLCADASGATSLLLTERAAHLSAHPGQVAFPGGKIERGESAGTAALREAREEVALPEDAAQLLGATEPYLTRTGFLVYPVLALLTRRVRLTPNPGEVATVFTVPFQDVMTLANHRHVEAMFDGQPRSYYEIVSSGKRIWGVTAAIMRLVHQKLYAP